MPTDYDLLAQLTGGVYTGAEPDPRRHTLPAPSQSRRDARDTRGHSPAPPARIPPPPGVGPRAPAAHLAPAPHMAPAPHLAPPSAPPRGTQGGAPAQHAPPSAPRRSMQLAPPSHPQARPPTSLPAPSASRRDAAADRGSPLASAASSPVMHPAVAASAAALVATAAAAASSSTPAQQRAIPLQGGGGSPLSASAPFQPSPARPFGGPVHPQPARGSNMSQYQPTGKRTYCPFVSLAVASGATVDIIVRPQLLFRADEIIIGGVVAPDFRLAAVKIGVVPQACAGGEVPAECFPAQNGPKFGFDIADQGTDITMSVHNLNAAAKDFFGILVGDEVYRAA